MPHFEEARDRWERIDALFAAVLERPPNERVAFLAAATGEDVALLRDVQSLLESLDTAERRIGESADALAAISGALGPLEEPFLLAGTRIGAYAIVQEIGRGGMGEVYLAERADTDFTRRVAIKLVRSDVPARTGSIVARFQAERRILAGLEHPHIARLYDSGVTPDGRPYLVMEHVAGVRIDKYADLHNLGVAQRLALFDMVCDAVAFAHQRLVIHRDLKPGNILVSEEGRVTLLDFGIARLLGGDEDGDTPTRAGGRLLTPEYSSPEQVRGDPPNAGMDVYALGVVLHELLAGARPSWQRLVATGSETAHVEGAMTAPSTTAPVALRRALRGDLDTILLTALAPDPTRRYSSVQALRDDIRRYGEGRPLVARPASLGYRAVKFVRRNPLGVAAAALVAILAIGFVTSTLIQSRRIAEERDRANSERDRAQQTAQLLTNMFKTGDPFAPGRPDTMRVAQFLDQGLERVNAELARQPLARAQLLTSLGDVYRWRGEHQRAATILDTAIALYRGSPAPPALELGEALTQLGNVRRLNGNFGAAESLHREALELRERAIWRAERSAQPLDERPIAASLANLGAIFIEQGKLDSAGPLIDSALVIQRRRSPIDTASVAEILNYKATVFFRRGDEKSALATIQEGHALNRARLGADHPRVALELGNVAILLGRQGRLAEAESALVEATRVLESRLAADHPQTVRAKANLAGMKGTLGKLAEADSLFRIVIDIDRRSTNELRVHLPVALDMHGDVLKKLGRAPEAQSAYREALALNVSLNGERHPSVAFAEIKLASALCESPRELGRVALAGYERGRRVMDAALPPGHPNRFGARGQHGDCLSRTGAVAAGEAELRASFDDAVKALGAAHTVTQAVGNLLVAHYTRVGRSASRDSVQATLTSAAAAVRR
jgi:serine/threonine-protein kinase